MGYTPPSLEVRKVGADLTYVYGGAATGDELFIYPNTIDASPYIRLDTNTGIRLQGGGASALLITQSGGNVILSNPIANIDTIIETTGTGLFRFGAYTAGAATDSTGYITIKDYAGNTRKLMVQA